MGKPLIPVDEVERNLVRSDIGGMMVVEAGAGTGKTSLLIDRLLTLLASNDIANLVAITFTEKAAGELADRLRRELERRIMGSEGINSRIALALANFDRANVSTIHAFAASLLRTNPIEAGLDPDFEHFEPDDESDLLDDLLAEELSHAAVARDADLQRFLNLGAHIGRVRELLGNLAENRDLLLNAFPTTHDAGLRSDLQSLIEEAQRLEVWARQDCVDPADKGIAQLSHLVGIAPANSSPDLEALVEWAEAATGLDTRPGKKGSWLDPGKVEEFKAEIRELARSAQSALANVRSDALCRLLNRLKELVDSAVEQKRISGKLGYQDLLIYAKELLSQPEALLSARDRFANLLIDEFQDTDPLQIEIAELLIGLNPGGLSASKSPGGRLCVVGDPKQSIYRFRRADSKVFQAASQRIEKLGRRVEIVQNFRSAQGLIDFFNAFFASIWPTVEKGSSSYVSLVAEPGRISAQPQPPVLLLIPPGGIDLSEMKATEVREIEAVALAQAIRQAVVVEGWQVTDKNAEGEMFLRPAGWSDIAVLFPTTTGLDIYAEAMNDAGIPCHIEGGKAIYRRQLATDILNCLTAIDNPADELAIVGAVRSSLLAVPDWQIVRWREQTGFLDYLHPSPGLPDLLSEALQILSNLHGLKNLSTPDLLLERLLEQVDGYAAIASSPGGAVDTELLDAVLGQARRWSVENGADLRGFRRRLASMIEKGDDPEAVPASESDSRVRLMTIHGAKGLEFPIVMLANLGRGRKTRPQVIFDRAGSGIHIRTGSKEEGEFSTPEFDQAMEVEEAELAAERMRLLYVAMTRARDHLVLPIFPSARTRSEYQDWLDCFLHAQGHFTGRDESLFRVLATNSATSQPATPGSQAVDVEAVWSRVESLRSLRSQALQTVKARLPHIIRPSRHESPDVGDSIAALSNELAKKIGKAAHRYMAQCRSFDELDGTLLTAMCAVENAPVGIVKPMILRLSQSYPCKEAIKSRNFHREAPLMAKSYQGVTRGIVDLLWEDAQGLHIADYKTGAYRPEAHQAQLNDYARAVAAATGKPIANAWIVIASDGVALQVKLGPEL